MKTQSNCARPEYWQPHNHRCECGTIWFHDPADIDDPVAHDKAHHCPTCNKEQFMTDSSGAVASVVFDGIKVKPFEPGIDCKDTEEKRRKRMGISFAALLDRLASDMHKE